MPTADAAAEAVAMPIADAAAGPVAGETADVAVGMGGWVPSFGRPSTTVDGEALANWAPPASRGRHRLVEPRPAASEPAAMEERASGDGWAAADGSPGDPSWVDGPPSDPSRVDAQRGDPLWVDGQPGDPSWGLGRPDGEQGDVDSAYGADDAEAAGTVWTPDDGWGPPRDRSVAPRLIADSSGRDTTSTGQQTDPAGAVEESAEADPSGEAEELEPVTARAHRISGRWGRFAELWVPEPLRNARLDPGRRGMVVLLLVAAVAATATAVGVWRDRPQPRPIETSTMAAASTMVPGSTPAGSASLAAAPVESQPAGEILVSVTGLVQSPGVVRLPVDARVADAITAAGGPAPGAVLTGMNLAAKLADGDSVVVSDAPAASAPTAGPSPPGAGGAASVPSGMVNLNTADAAALDTLPGVGPVMAQNIIAWRESNGKFTSVEQLQEISGIGPSRYAQISALVTVG